jgi:hypothetical protein
MLHVVTCSLCRVVWLCIGVLYRGSWGRCHIARIGNRNILTNKDQVRILDIVVRSQCLPRSVVRNSYCPQRVTRHNLVLGLGERCCWRCEYCCCATGRDGQPCSTLHGSPRFRELTEREQGLRVNPLSLVCCLLSSQGAIMQWARGFAV